MSILYPAALDGTTQLPQPTGTQLLTTPDHAGGHSNLSLAVIAVETTVGTTLGTNVLKNFAAGDFAARINASNVPQQLLSNGTINNPVIGTPAITGGTGISMTLGTPAIDSISARNSGSAIIFKNSITPNVGSVADAAGGTLIADAAASNFYYSVMGTSAGNRTIGTPINTNASSPELLTFAFKSSGSANGTLVWASVFRFSQDIGTPTLGTGVTWNYFGWRYNTIDTKWDFMGQSLNLI